MPIFGQLTRKFALAKFTRTFGTLVQAGVPILSALDIVADTAGNAVVAEAVKKTRSAIKEGETIAKPLGESKVFPSMLVQMIAVGEETGALDAMLNKIADFYDEEVSTAVDGLTSLIEPLMMASLGAIVGGMVVALYLPMFTGHHPRRVALDPAHRVTDREGALWAPSPRPAMSAGWRSASSLPRASCDGCHIRSGKSVNPPKVPRPYPDTTHDGCGGQQGPPRTAPVGEKEVRSHA